MAEQWIYSFYNQSGISGLATDITNANITGVTATLQSDIMVVSINNKTFRVSSTLSERGIYFISLCAKEGYEVVTYSVSKTNKESPHLYRNLIIQECDTAYTTENTGIYISYERINISPFILPNISSTQDEILLSRMTYVLYITSNNKENRIHDFLYVTQNNKYFDPGTIITDENNNQYICLDLDIFIPYNQ